jgi:transcriptional regulator with XRE-family HTH domain
MTYRVRAMGGDVAQEGVDPIVEVGKKSPRAEFLEFGKRLNALMELRGISANDISIQLKVAIATVNFWRQGMMRPRHPSDLGLAAMMSVSPGYLIYGDGDSTKSNVPPAPGDCVSQVAGSSIESAVSATYRDLLAARVSDVEWMPVLSMMVQLLDVKSRS